MNNHVAELLNARHQDLQFELGVYLQLDQIKDRTDSCENTVQEMKSHFMEVFEIDVEEVADDEDIEVSDVTDGLIQDAMKLALDQSNAEMRTLIQLPRTLGELRRLGATEENLQGLKDFQKVLEERVYNRYNITEEDLKEDSDE